MGNINDQAAVMHRLAFVEARVSRILMHAVVRTIRQAPRRSGIDDIRHGSAELSRTRARRIGRRAAGRTPVSPSL